MNRKRRLVKFADREVVNFTLFRKLRMRLFGRIIMKHLWFFVLAFAFGVSFSEAQTPQFTVKIERENKGEPLSPLIYGQFIEHLGRCIYGGIWAEMLEDRKFYYPVGDKESPWYAIYDCKMNMNKTDAFVGAHTPESIADAEARWLGVAQKNLAIQKDRKYVGYAWVKATEGIEKVEVHFHWSTKHDDFTQFQYPVKFGEYYKIEFEFDAPVDFDNLELEVAAFGKGSFFVGTVSLMPADNVHGMRKDTLALLKELDSPIYRWPGGNFVSGYDWKDGIGDRDKRPPRKNPAWTGVEHNDFGVNEFMLFCKTLGTEPYIAVNTGDGNVENAVAELQYVNGSADTKWGKLRAEQGHPQSYGVKWWGIGNEMYGDWQIGHMPVEKYVEKNNTFVDAFRKEDKNVRLIAVGAVGKWDEAFLPGAADHMDDISEHFYVQEKEDVVQHMNLVPNSIRHIADAHRKYRKEMPQLAGKNIRIAMDEWNYWYGPHLFGELGTRYFMKDALGIAAGVHQYAKDSDLFVMANYAQTVNVIGCIKTNKTSAQFETTGLVLKLYRKEFGSIPVATTCDSPLNIQAATSEDGKTLTLGIVNPLSTPVELTLTGLGAAKSGQKFEIRDPQNDPKGFNDPGQTQRIKIEQSDFALDGDRITVEPLSVTLIKVR